MARFKEFHPEYITEDIEENVDKMLACGLLENGFFEYMCLSCLNTHKVGKVRKILISLFENIKELTREFDESGEIF